MSKENDLQIETVANAMYAMFGFMDDCVDIAKKLKEDGQLSSSSKEAQLEQKNKALIVALNEIKNLPSSRMDEGSQMAWLAIKENKAS